MSREEQLVVSRRDFVKLGAAAAATSGLRLPSSMAAAEGEPGVRFAGFVIPPQPKVQEATLSQLNGRYWLLFGENHKMVGKFSDDHGRTWGKTIPLRTGDGQGISLARNNAHHSLLRLKSGKLGLVYGGPLKRPGRDGTVEFRWSEDEGKTWSTPVVIEPLFALCRTASCRVLSSGRIVAPTLKWISWVGSGKSESEENQFVYSWVNYSDDEGQTWKKSLSELYVSVNKGHDGFYSFDEPGLEELADGRLMMIARTQLGRPYQSFSEDGGVSWSSPEPVELASGIAPQLLIGIPGTDHLLLVWNQISTTEMMSGQMRHRLSTAVSKDNGKTWTHFRNLESLDDRTRIQPPPPEPRQYLMKNYAYTQPQDRKQYPHAPGCLRVCYPTATFWNDEVAITYDYGYGGPGPLQKGHATKIKVVSLDWIYERV
jgi:hypothetical protein